MEKTKFEAPAQQPALPPDNAQIVFQTINGAVLMAIKGPLSLMLFKNIEDTCTYLRASADGLEKAALAGQA